MQSSFCKYENNEVCMLLKGKCDPGRKGCVISRGFKFTDKPKTDDLKQKKTRTVRGGS
jgi:hypothetical protein